MRCQSRAELVWGMRRCNGLTPALALRSIDIAVQQIGLLSVAVHRLCRLPALTANAGRCQGDLNGPAVTRSVSDRQGPPSTGVIDGTAAIRALPLAMTWSPTSVTRAPGVSPAAAAGLPSVTSTLGETHECGRGEQYDG